jgi:superfamily II DNA or RNA helicase
MITLRDYQQTQLNQVRAEFSKGHRRVLLQAPTGAGKGAIAGYIVQSATDRSKRVMIIAHRAEILDQLSGHVKSAGIEHSWVQAGKPTNQLRTVQIASIQTLVRRVDQIIPPDLVILDESHHATSLTYKTVMAKWPLAKILGLTATPWRLDGSGLKSEFDVMVLGPTSEWLIDNGFLARPVYYAPPKTVDVSGVKTRCGDYVSNELETLFDTPTVTGNAVEHYIRACPNEKAVAFCVSLKHSQHICDAFNASGISASTIDGEMEREQRKRIMEQFRNGQIKVLTSVDLIGEGVDVPSVGAAILLRPTKSLTLHLQQIGRALRMSPGKERAVILDHAGNLKRHGLAETVREWTLEGQPKRKRGEQEERIDVKQCKKCYVVFQGGRCPNCQTAPEGREVNAVGGQLVQLTEEDKLALKVQRKAEQRNAKSLDDLIALGKSRGYKYPRQWAERLMKFRHERKQTTPRSKEGVGETPEHPAISQ